MHARLFVRMKATYSLDVHGEEKGRQGDGADSSESERSDRNVNGLLAV